MDGVTVVKNFGDAENPWYAQGQFWLIAVLAVAFIVILYLVINVVRRRGEQPESEESPEAAPALGDN